MSYPLRFHLVPGKNKKLPKVGAKKNLAATLPSCFFIAMIKYVILWVHIPFYLMYFVRSMRTVFCHYNCSFEFSVYYVLIQTLKSFFNKR